MDVKNTGSKLGDEVVQVYVTDMKASVQRPDKQLVAFDRVSIAPNQTKTLELSFPAKDLAFWDVKKKTFVVEPGKFKLMVGSSSKDIKVTNQFEIK